MSAFLRWVVFLVITGAGLMFLGSLAMVTFLYYPNSVPVLGTKLTGSETSLLLLSVFSFGSGFLLVVLAPRQVLIDSAWTAARKKLESSPKQSCTTRESDRRKALESRRKARWELFMKFAASGLVLLGLVSAFVIFLTQIEKGIKRDPTVLWWLFVSSTFLGGLAALLAQQEVADRTSGVKSLLAFRQ